MEPASLSFGIVSLAMQLVQTAKAVKEYISAYKSASKELQSLVDKLDDIEAICCSLEIVLTDVETPTLKPTEVTLLKKLRRIIQQCLFKVSDIHNILDAISKRGHLAPFCVTLQLPRVIYFLECQQEIGKKVEKAFIHDNLKQVQTFFKEGILTPATVIAWDEYDPDNETSLLGLAALTISRSVFNFLATQTFDTSNRYRIPQQKMIWIVENLECLGRRQSKKRKLTEDENEKPETPYWFRKTVNGFTESNFVALSYTWDASEYETQNPRNEGHKIETRDGQEAWRSSVRNSVLERITKYMQCHNVLLLWIDRHSIPQKKCKQPACTHTECRQKRHALDAMDRVYSLSDHPVALLGRPIQDEDEIRTLSSILKGALVRYHQGEVALSKGAEYNKARKMLCLLYEITRDKWWTRAWTFQENYRAGLKMTLLIHHSPNFEETKRSILRGKKPLFGVVPGELSVQSARFSESATKFCLAFRRHHFVTSSDEEMIDHILGTAGKYTILLSPASSMSGTIISDVRKRGVTEPWDCLAIIANCCQYAIRLNSMRLQDSGISLELSILALRLLNGEILKNDELPISEHEPMIEQINGLFFDDFRAPESEKRLTFNKSCRFVDVEFTKTGIVTRGHLWKLDETLRAPRSSPRLSQPSQKGDQQLSDYERTRLRQLAELVKAKKGRKEAEVVNDMKEFLEEDAFVVDEDESFSLRYRRLMAKEVVMAMDVDQSLTLGYLCDSSGQPRTVRAIFIRKRHVDEADELLSQHEDEPTHVFTSLWSEDQPDDEYLANDLDHHVSLGVRLLDDEYDKPLRLYTKEWILGLCFFTGAATNEVVFPWPQPLSR
ncbi:hypothetical protein FBEOM_1837 [Fusarium beomiforme]|uniref:Heterokaryon incompatibility domain-containing protein n=1 Tax=Fusarium beomiforme TaxID=44412 RepID=A0A9P5AT63_9HYPO|nr:hypothetical protein FBEOM_1837 [Fusarium beomiforme]